MVKKVFRQFYKDVDAFFSDRWGGVSKPPYEELNLALHVGDDPLHVLENRQILAKSENFYIDNLIYIYHMFKKEKKTTWEDIDRILSQW